MRLKDIMQRKVEVIAADESLDRARTLMRLRRIHHLVVVDEGRVVGIVTEDILGSRDAESATTVKEVMFRGVVTAAPDSTVRKAANLMRGRAAGALPILDREQLVGIITVSDLLTLLGKGAERPVEKGRRWTLRHRGVKPQARPTVGRGAR